MVGCSCGEARVVHGRGSYIKKYQPEENKDNKGIEIKFVHFQHQSAGFMFTAISSRIMNIVLFLLPIAIP